MDIIQIGLTDGFQIPLADQYALAGGQMKLSVGLAIKSMLTR